MSSSPPRRGRLRTHEPYKPFTRSHPGLNHVRETHQNRPAGSPVGRRTAADLDHRLLIPPAPDRPARAPRRRGPRARARRRRARSRRRDVRQEGDRRLVRQRPGRRQLPAALLRRRDRRASARRPRLLEREGRHRARAAGAHAWPGSTALDERPHTGGPARPSPGTTPDPTSPARRRRAGSDGPSKPGDESGVPEAGAGDVDTASSSSVPVPLLVLAGLALLLVAAGSIGLSRPPPAGAPAASDPVERSSKARLARSAADPRSGIIVRTDLRNLQEFLLRTNSRVRPTLSLACAIRSADRQVAGEEIFNSRDGSGGRDGDRQAGQG